LDLFEGCAALRNRYSRTCKEYPAKIQAQPNEENVYKICSFVDWKVASDETGLPVLDEALSIHCIDCDHVTAQINNMVCNRKGSCFDPKCICDEDWFGSSCA